MRATRHTLDYWQAHKVGGIGNDVSLFPLILLPEREWLYERCDRRFEIMLEQGAAEEVEALKCRQLDPTLPVMRAIGVREIAAWLDGEMSREEMIASGQLATRRYAKRQYTWFRNQPPEEWQRCESESCDIETTFAGLFHK